MQTGLNLRPPAEVITDALAVLAFEDERPQVDGAAVEWVNELYDSGEFTGEIFTTATLHRPAGLKARRLVLAGCGKRGSFSPPDLRKVTGALVRKIRSKAVKRIALLLDQPWQSPGAAAAAVEGALLGAYEPDLRKTDPKKEEARLESFSVVADGDRALEGAVERGRVIADYQNFARELAAEPGNHLTPTELARRATEMAAALGLASEVLDGERMRLLGMGALLGVAQGSAEPPAFIVIRYQPPQPSTGGIHLGLIGKGVTFDTGGISIKPSEKMDQMRYDMAGGAAAIAAMGAIAQLKPPIAVTAFVPAVENMPGSRAQRPGDIVTTLSGKTVEVLNTDAEGRLILADAITYSQRLGCTHLVDAATLTGSIVVSLGHVFAGAFTNNQELLDRLLAAAGEEGERIWTLPLDEEYKEHLKSSFADLQNIGPRAAGAITAAWFLKEFADPLPWVHLDIAGTAWLEENKPFMAKGPTGICVRTMVRLALDW